MAAVTGDIGAALSRVMRHDHGRLIAALASRLGDVQLAEDCLQEAMASALGHWALTGLPQRPEAWLLRVAQRKAIDRFRREARFRAREAEIALLAESEAELDAHPEIPDERLRLIFTCCHPALARKTRVALTLRLLGGLSTGEIARAFLDKPAAMGQRLSRAKQKIAAARIPFVIPEGSDLPARLASVLDVIYLIFNEGYAATDGAQQLRTGLCEEAIFLARMVAKLAPDEPEATGLLALALLTHARRGARCGPDGSYIPLDGQDRRLWDSALIQEGRALVADALRAGRVGPYQLKAAIAALHCEAESHQATDWPQISALYRLLAALEDTPVVRLNLAVARAQTEGPERALAEIAPLAHQLDAYQPFHAARAELLAQSGDRQAARAAYERAIVLSSVASEATFLRQRLARLTEGQGETGVE